MHPTAASSMRVESIPAGLYSVSFAVFTGVTVDYVGVREKLEQVVLSASRGGGWQLWSCGFFGDNLTQMTNNGRSNGTPSWSPDGSKIAWTYYSATKAGEILVRPASGGPATHLSNNTADDEHPTWSPDGEWIAFHSDRTGDDRIYKMISTDGSGQKRLSDAGVGQNDIHPDWWPDARDGGGMVLLSAASGEMQTAAPSLDPEILFASDRTGQYQIWGMTADGLNEEKQVSSGDPDDAPAWHPFTDRLAYRRSTGPGYGYDIYTNRDTDTDEHLFVGGTGTESQPCYSMDGRYIFFVSNREGGVNSIWAKQVHYPYRSYRITNAAGPDKEPDLGNPTPQISRVLVGPAGSDHGYDPIHASAIAGVLAFGAEGYLNFIRLGIPPASGPSLTATPLDDGGVQLAGIVLSAPNMYYIEEDAGIGVPPKIWDFTGATSRSCVLYMNTETGKLVTVVDLGDSVHSAAADGPSAGITQQQSGGGTIIRGAFKRVWDADGVMVAEGEIGTIEIDAANRVVRAF
ncbi:MAG: hypothetical protein GF393_03955 [Armatimonadia bacterium]|nr:hypothetical protein [Armatimonadia bacterium]